MHNSDLTFYSQKAEAYRSERNKKLAALNSRGGVQGGAVQRPYIPGSLKHCTVCN
jgi:hypothetical protein